MGRKINFTPISHLHVYFPPYASFLCRKQWEMGEKINFPPISHLVANFPTYFPPKIAFPAKKSSHHQDPTISYPNPTISHLDFYLGSTTFSTAFSSTFNVSSRNWVIYYFLKISILFHKYAH